VFKSRFVPKKERILEQLRYSIVQNRAAITLHGIYAASYQYFNEKATGIKCE
jgi:hypothetical protein